MRYRYYFVPVIAFLFGMLSTEALFAQQDIKIEGTYQIEKDQRHGWVILNVEIPEGFHVYALTQKGSPPPTKIKLEESGQFELMDKFKADKKPKVIEHDPIFDQRIEKYTGKVALMAPIKVANATDLENVEFDLKISGQLCNDNGCRLFNNKKIEIEFAGYYDRDEKKKKKSNGL